MRDLLGEPAPHPRDGDAGVHSGRRRRCRACRRAGRATRRTGSTRSATRARRCRTSTTPVRSPRRVLLGNVALRFPGERLLWDAANHEGDEQARGRSVRPAHLPTGLVAVGCLGAAVAGAASGVPHAACDVPDLDGGIGIAGRRELGDLRRFSHEAMNTVFEVYAAHADARYAAQAAQAAFALVDRLEGELSRFRHNSDITRVNHLTRRARAHASARPRSSACVIARHVFDLTGGAFDIAIGTGLPSLEIDADDFLVRATAGRRARRSRRHRQGLRGGSDGGAARGVGPRPRLRPRRLQLRARPRGAGGPRRLAADPERSPASPRGCSPASRCARRRSARPASARATTSCDPRTGEPVRGRLAAWVALPRPATRGRRTAGRGRAQARACRRGGRADDRLHAAERRGDRGLVRAQSRPRGLGAPTDGDRRGGPAIRTCPAPLRTRSGRLPMSARVYSAGPTHRPGERIDGGRERQGEGRSTGRGRRAAEARIGATC